MRSSNAYAELAINTESMDGFDSTPLGSSGRADSNVASPSYETENSKKNVTYSQYVTGRAMEVAKRRNIIERLDRARDSGILHCAIPQLRELSATQLSMFLRRLFKSSPGLREFVSDEVVHTIFEDAEQQKDSKKGAVVEEPKEEFVFEECPNESGEETEPESPDRFLSDDDLETPLEQELPVS